MIGLHEFAANSPFYDLIGATLCNETNPWHEICTNVLFLLCGFDPEQMDPVCTLVNKNCDFFYMNEKV